ncbi:hypothetical protein Tco_0329251 [Tanacetum coccineum]
MFVRPTYLHSLNVLDILVVLTGVDLDMDWPFSLFKDFLTAVCSVCSLVVWEIEPQGSLNYKHETLMKKCLKGSKFGSWYLLLLPSELTEIAQLMGERSYQDMSFGQLDA